MSGSSERMSAAVGLVVGICIANVSAVQAQTTYVYYGTVSGLGPADIPLQVTNN